jgi:hypothetical protein
MPHYPDDFTSLLRYFNLLVVEAPPPYNDYKTAKKSLVNAAQNLNLYDCFATNLLFKSS